MKEDAKLRLSNKFQNDGKIKIESDIKKNVKGFCTQKSRRVKKKDVTCKN